MTCSSSGSSNCVLSPAFKFTTDSCSWTITLSIISSTVLPFGIPTPSLPVNPVVLTWSSNRTKLTQSNNNDKSIYYILGGVIGGILVVGIVSLLAGHWYYRNRKKEVIPDTTSVSTLDTIKHHKPSI
jgi:hypothetical protein